MATEPGPPDDSTIRLQTMMGVSGALRAAVGEVPLHAVPLPVLQGAYTMVQAYTHDLAAELARRGEGPVPVPPTPVDAWRCCRRNQDELCGNPRWCMEHGCQL